MRSRRGCGAVRTAPQGCSRHLAFSGSPPLSKMRTLAGLAAAAGVGGWAGIGMAAGLQNDTDGLGAVGAYRSLDQFTQLGGVMTVFALPD